MQLHCFADFLCLGFGENERAERMRESLEMKMKDAVRFFKKRAEVSADKTDAQTAEWLSDNYYILERYARQSAEECRNAEKILKGSDLLPSLFDRCVEMCQNGELPDEKKIIEFFSKDGLDGISAGFLPLAVTCALINSAVSGIKKQDAKQLGNAVKSLRRLSETDFETVAEKLCVSEECLLSDPAGVYPSMDKDSKNFYRNQIALSAYKSRKSEKKLAESALKKAQRKDEHIGKYIISNNKNTKRGWLYIIMGIVMPLAFSVAAGLFFAEPAVAVLLFFPMWEILRRPIEKTSLKGIPAERLLRLSVNDKRVLDCHALITVSTIMPSADKMDELEARLEQLYLSNCEGKIKVCCLADFKAAGMPRKPEDKHILKAAKDAVDRLNGKYGSGFILAVRPRSYSDTQNEFIGKERKRGAITELVRAIKGKSKGFLEIYGDTDNLEKVRYLIALDWDTVPDFDSARELIAIAEHPLNAPVIKNGRVVDGYGLLVPKIENRLSDEKTYFSHLMAGDTGFAAYDSVSGERYQTLFGESIFCGKGLINVDSYYKLLDKGLPRETILSHDIIESGYLRAGYAADVQFTESFPQSVGSYFQRMHRWVRGDWQNIRFIFGKNPMNRLSRYKIFDNLRRSTVSLFCLFAILASAVIQGYEGITVAVAAALAVCSDKLFEGFSSLFKGGAPSLTRLYFSRDLPPALDAFFRAFISLAFIARESFVCADAACKALWRLFVSGDKLLEWTTAAQNERQKSFGGLLVSCIPSAVVAAVILIFGLPIHRLLGLIILADIPITLLSGAKIKKRNKKISSGQKETLISYASSMWNFFDDLCGKENNFLPPDNIQLSPSREVAKRTSPTNIGLMLASFLAARDFGFITTAELYMRLNLSLSSVEKLEKYKGNLLNWYSTTTLEPLTPRFVSTVDSGNFLCCLIAVKEGLREYLPECALLSEIIDRIEKLIDETDFTPLYNERKKLFHIGLDADSSQKSESSYDLYMSEIRMTAYMAVAKKLVPKNHWGAMGRIPVGRGRYTGLASWTGTMFEYFMPDIFLPAPEGSLSSEALYFCLYSQRKRAGRLPFGISESGFYAFDGNLNYQYKAHGVQNLGLKHGLNSETVISPYSSFLSLTAAPQMALKNLSRLERMGMTGKYGFFEASDFTNGKNGSDFSIVRSFMSHHVGMSLLAVDNMLNDRCIQRRFMQDCSMKGAQSLLEEKGRISAKPFKDIKVEGIPKLRERVQSQNTVSECLNPFNPKAVIYSNGRMTTCLTDSGAGVSIFDGVDVTVNSYDPIQRPQGVFGVFVTEKGRMPFVRALDQCPKAKYKAEFFKDKAVYTAKNPEISQKLTVKLLKQQNCELRTFTVENTGKKKNIKGKLVIYFEPCIEKRQAYAAHPAFSKLFLIDEWDEENQCFLFSRRSRDSEVPCAIAAGFVGNVESAHESSREQVLRTPKGVFSIGERTDFSGKRGNPDCCCAFVVEIDLKPNEKASFDFAMVVDETKEQALDSLLAVRYGKKSKKQAENPFFSDTLENAFANKILPSVFYPQLMSGSTKTGEKCSFKKEDLWSFGISGDLPIVLVKVNGEEETSSVLPYLRLNKILRSCGILTDLAVLYSDKDEYTSPVLSALKKAVESEQCSLMIGVRGGVHIVSKAAHTYNQLLALEKYSAHISDGDQNSLKTHFKPLKTELTHKSKNNKNDIKHVKQYNFTERKITIEKTPVTVDIPWTMVYSNRSFGTMVSDKALGFTWAINSRENKLTPWYNDTMSDNRGEILFLKNNGVLYDLVSIGKAEFTPEKACWYATVEGLKIEISVSVAGKGMTKKCSVKIENKSNKKRDFELMYYTLPVLGAGRESSGVFYIQKHDDAVIIESPNSEIPGFMSLSCKNADCFCFSRQDFFEGNFTSNSNEITKDCCAAVGKKVSLNPNQSTDIEFCLSWGASQKAALAMPLVAKFNPVILNPAEIKTTDKKLNLFFNSFLYSQVKQSRFFGRTGFYQCSGAYGFRDQLQDCLAFIDYEPQLAFVHISRCASVQFEQGDVLHWWHVSVDKSQKIKGIRTRCSDDMLWLPYACLTYYEKTKDKRIFEVTAPYLIAEPLSENEKERYFSPKRTEYKESILQHCIKAIEFSMNYGQNGLPLISSCDWNDGFSRIGETRNAESVWLAMFQKLIFEKMSVVLRDFEMHEKADEYSINAKKLNDLITKSAFLGDCFARLIYGDGSKSDFLDILPQAFSVLADIGTKEEQHKALKTAFEKLFDSEWGVVRLLSPSFSDEAKDSVGYIASYPEGIRENGGQYTHAAVWLVMAMYKFGMKDEALRLLSAINPLSHYSNERLSAAYRAEPYVLAGDVSYGKEISGRGGWSHFTGSAAWLFRFTADHAKENNTLDVLEFSEPENHL